MQESNIKQNASNLRLIQILHLVTFFKFLTR